jgi:hypothetical protein
MGSMDKRATRSLACISASRLSSSAKVDDPVIAGPRERHGIGLDSLPLRLLDARFRGHDDGV